MIYSLNLPLYKNGYTIKEFNCIDIPICAASGYYSDDNYFLLGFLLAVKYNWGYSDGNGIFQSSEETLNNYTDLLHGLGIRFNSEPIANKDQLLNVIHEKIKSDIPVLILTKYKYLYYSPYFMDDEGDRFHMLVIDKYNSKTGVITLRDSAALNGIKLLDDEVCVLLPIAVKEEEVCEIWENTKAENADLFYLEKTGDEKEFKNILDICKKIIEEGNNSFSFFSKKFIDYKEHLSKAYFYYYTRFIGSISGMFKIINHFCEKENFNYIENFSSLEKDYIEKRCKQLNVLTKYAISDIMPSDFKLNSISDKILELDKQYLPELFQKCSELFGNKINYNYVPLNIEAEFNNKAFKSNTGSEPDISGNGIYFVIPQNEIENKLRKNKTTFKLGDFENTIGYDNISCDGQSIFTEGHQCKKLNILACSEYGSYEEELSLRKDGVEIEKAKFAVSDFYMNPIYNEEIFCSGGAFQRFDTETKQLDFTSKIFEYRIYPENTDFDVIVLPKRKNIHIFAITLCN